MRDGSRSRRLQAADHAQQRGLATARWPQQSDEFTILDNQIDAIERMHRHLLRRCGAEPVLLMGGGAAVKLAPETDLPFELVDTLIFEGLLALADDDDRQRGG